VKRRLRLGPGLVAAAMVVVYVTCAFLIQLFNARSGRFSEDPAGNVGLLLAFSAYMATGVLIILRRPGNAMGWILSSIGLLVMIGALAGEYVAYVLEAGMVDAPALIPAAWLAEWYWFPTLALVLLFTPLLFPDGTPVSRRWRPVLWAGMAVTGVITVMAALSENLGEPDFSLPNPVGVAGMPDVEDSTIGNVLFILLAVSILAAAASVVVRYRRSRGDERQQLKWFTFAAIVTALIPVTEDLVQSLADVSVETDLPFAVAISLLPIAIGVAIFRYRLYEIDRLISLTVSYAVIAAVLVAVYAGAILALGSLVGRENPLAVAGATLAAAALFSPVWRRVQSFIDRRFNRSRYDATRVVDGFASRLREEVDLKGLTTDLTGVVGRTLHPASLSLWLREDQ
jgi:hypothetical protein